MRPNVKCWLLLASVKTTCIIFYFVLSENSVPVTVKNDVFVRPNYVPKNFPNVPQDYYKKFHNFNGINQTCARYPQFHEIKYNNYFWQQLDTSNGTFYLLNAYLDNRTPSNSIRIIGMISKLHPAIKTYCQIWYEEDKKPFITKAYYTWIWKQSYGLHNIVPLHPYMISCEISKDKTPVSVSLVEKYCDKSTTNLKIINEKVKEKDTFGVCVKGIQLTQNDSLVKLIEWIEVIRAMGASKIYLYELYVTPEIKKALNYYEKLNMVEVNPITLPANEPNIPTMQNNYLKTFIGNKRMFEVVLYNDCFYKNMQKYDWIALLDIDEIIMPIKYYDWHELFQNIDNSISFASFYNVYFLDGFLKEKNYNEKIPRDFHMLQHAYRSKWYNNINEYMKSFFNTTSVLTLQNHLPFECLKTCKQLVVSYKIAHMQHYRKDCVSDFKMCRYFKARTVKDDTILKIKDVVIVNVETALQAIKENSVIDVNYNYD